MLTFLLYELKVFSVSTAFYIFYKLLMRNDTWFKLRRAVLLSSSFLSVLLPFCVITIKKEEVVNISAMLVQGLSSISPSDYSHNSFSSIHIFFYVLTLAILFGNAYMLISFFHDLISIFKYLRNKECIYKGNVKICLTDEPMPPFSFMHYIVMSRSDYKSANKLLFAHELHHIRQNHTLDLVFMELYLVVQWFNPVAWKIRTELRMVHEYDADEQVVRSTGLGLNYLHMLISRAGVGNTYSLTNTFSKKNTLKQRFAALSHNRSSKWCKTKVLFILPLTVVLMLCFSKTETTYKYDSSQLAPDSTGMMSFSEAGGRESILRYDENLNAEISRKNSAIYDSIRNMSPYSDSIIVYKSSASDTANISRPPIGSISKVKIIEDSSSQSHIQLKDTVLKEVDDDLYLLTINSDDNFSGTPKGDLSIKEPLPDKRGIQVNSGPTSTNSGGYMSMQLSFSGISNSMNVSAYKISVSQDSKYIVVFNNHSVNSSSILSGETVVTDYQPDLEDKKTDMEG